MQRYRKLSCLLLTGFLMMAAVMGGLFIPSALADPPTAPTNLQANAVSTTEIDLTWNDRSTEETGYLLERTQGSYVTPIDLPVDSHSYADTGLTENTTYSYRVKAVKAGQDSVYTESVTVTTDGYPNAPTGLTANASASQVVLSWTDNSNEEYFRIKRKTTGDYVSVDVVLADVTTFTDTSVDSNTRYSYVVVATKGGYATTSDPLEVNTPDRAPQAPTNLTAGSITNTRVTLSWTDASDNESNFIVYRKTGIGGYSEVGREGANTTSFVDSGLTAGTAYTYKVRAINLSGQYNDSSEKSVTTSGGVAVPDAPASLSATASSSSAIYLSWSNVSNENGYVIQRKTGTGTYSDFTSVAAERTYYSNNGLSAGKTYYYRVRAYNAAGNSLYSNEAHATTEDTGSGNVPNAAPYNLVATPYSSSQINLTWDQYSTNETDFKIERKKTYSGTWTEVGSASANIESYSDKGLASGTVYFYRVRAHNSYGYSDYSPIDSASTTGTANDGDLPVAPDNFRGEGYSDYIYLTWNDNSDNEDGFKIYRKSEDESSYTLKKTTGSEVEEWTDNYVEEGLDYYYKIYAYNDEGDSDYDTVTVTASGSSYTPKAPSSLYATADSSTSVYLKWTDNSSDETGFKIERKKSGGSYTMIDTIGKGKTTYNDNDLTAGTTYYYRVRAYNSYGNSAYCTEDSVTTLSSSLSAPTNLTGYASGSSVYLSWTDKASGETGYRIERKSGSSGSYSEIGTVGANVTRYTDTYTVTGNTYYYRVRAYASSQNSGYSSTVSVTVSGSKPSGSKVLQFYIGNRAYFANGSAQVMDSSAIIMNGRTLLPIRYVGTPLGATVDWSKADKKVTVTLGSTKVELWIGNSMAKVNGAYKLIDPTNAKVVPVIVSGRTMLPIRFITENLGCDVEWNSNLQEVKITY